MPVIAILFIYVVVGALAFSYPEFLIWKVVAGGLFGVSIGVNELKDGSSFTTVVIGVCGALCMLLSMAILGLLSIDNYLPFYVFGVFASISIYFIHTRWS